MRKTVYVVVENGWNGISSYTTDDAHVFSTKEDAERCAKHLDERYGADVDTFITECEIDTYFTED